MYYKFLSTEGTPCNGGKGVWHRNGKWMPAIKNIELCKRGYHLCRFQDLLRWAGPVLWEVDWRGKRIECDDEVVVSEARLVRRVRGWNETNCRLFAVDCALRVLPLFEKEHPKDKRPRKAIEVATAFVEGKATRKELEAAGDAARDAARDVAWAASGDAARDAAWAAVGAAVGVDAGDVAGDAARAAAWDVAWDVAWVDAWAAEKEWQNERLRAYLA